MNPLDIASILGSLAGPITAGIAGQNSQQWLHGLLASILNIGGDAQQQGKTNYEGYTNDVFPQLLQALTSVGAQTYGPNGQLGKTQDQINSQNDETRSLYGGADAYKTGNTDIQAQIQQLLQKGKSGDLAGQVFQGGGWTPQSQQGFDQISQLLSGGLPGSENATAIMNQLFANQGSNDTSTAYTGAGRQALSDGGFTPTLNAAGAPLQKILGQGGDFANNDILRAFGLDALSSGGYTPNSAQGAQTALSGIQSGGATDTTQGLQKRGLELANREPLLPTEMAMSLARENAGRSSIDQFTNMTEQAIKRGGGPGATLGNGLQNQVYLDFADKIAQNESKAVGDALLGQQQLGLQQQLAGSGIAGTGISGENSRLNSFSDLLSSLEGGATNRYQVGGNIAGGANSQETQRLLSALGLIPEIQNSATGVMGTVGGLGLKGADLENTRMSTAADLMKTLSGNELSKNNVGLTQLANLLKGQNDYALGAGNLERGTNSDMGNILGLLLNNSLSGGKLDLDKITQLTTSLQGGNRNSLDLGSLLTGAFGQTAQNSQGLFGPWMQYANTGLGTLAGTGGNSASAANPYAGLGR